jgi:hypothetical protein
MQAMNATSGTAESTLHTSMNTFSRPTKHEVTSVPA